MLKGTLSDIQSSLVKAAPLRAPYLRHHLDSCFNQTDEPSSIWSEMIKWDLIHAIDWSFYSRMLVCTPIEIQFTWLFDCHVQDHLFPSSFIISRNGLPMFPSRQPQLHAVWSRMSVEEWANKFHWKRSSWTVSLEMRGGQCFDNNNSRRMSSDDRESHSHERRRWSWSVKRFCAVSITLDLCLLSVNKQQSCVKVAFFWFIIICCYYECNI